MSPAAPRGGANVVLLFISLGVVTLLGSLNQTLFAPALPTLVADLDGLDQMPWVIAAYMLGSIPTMPVFGKLSDVFGRKPLLLVSIALFTIGSAAGAAAPTMGWLIAGRVLQGIGSGGLVILPQATVADVVPARRRGFYVGILTSVFTVSSLTGPYIGGLLTQGPGWRWTFGINVILGVVAAAGVVVLLRLPRRPRSGPLRVDVAGMLLVSVAATSLALGTTWGGTRFAWDSPVLLGIVAAGVAGVLGLVLVERRAPDPLLPPALFRERNFVLTSIASICMGILMFSVVGYMPTYVQMTIGASPSQAGLFMIPMSLASMLSSTVTGWLVARFGVYKPYPIGGALLAAIGMLMLSGMSPGTPVVLPGIAIALIGLGLGASFQNLLLIVQNSFPHAMVGTATAGSSLFRQIGGMFGTTLVGSVFLHGLTLRLVAGLSPADLAKVGTSPGPDLVHGLAGAVHATVVQAYNDALTPVYLLMAPIAVTAAIVLCFVRARPLKETIE